VASNLASKCRAPGTLGERRSRCGAPQRNRNEMGETTVNKTCLKQTPPKQKSTTYSLRSGRRGRPPQTATINECRYRWLLVTRQRLMRLRAFSHPHHVSITPRHQGRHCRPCEVFQGSRNVFRVVPLDHFD